MKPDPLSGRWEVREIGGPRLGTFDPEPRGPNPWLLIGFGLLYGLGFGSATIFIARDQLFGEPQLGDYLLVALYGLGYLLTAFLLLFYVLYNARRFRFSHDGLWLQAPTRRRFVGWEEIRRARRRIITAEWATYHRLDLFPSRRQRIGIPLSDFRKGATLLAAIRRRLPIDIEEPDQPAENVLEDQPDT